MKQYKPREKSYNIDVEVNYAPFPTEQARRYAYDTHAKLFLKAKERVFKNSGKTSAKEGRLETALP